MNEVSDRLFLGRIVPGMDVCDVTGEKVGSIAHIYRFDEATTTDETTPARTGDEMIEVKRYKEKARVIVYSGFELIPGNDLLSHALVARSTIGAEGLNCRVRNGNGCCPLATATGKTCFEKNKDNRTEKASLPRSVEFRHSDWSSRSTD